MIRRMRARGQDGRPHGPGWRSRWADDTGSIPLALLISFIGVALSTVLATEVMTQVVDTRTSKTENQAVAAAQAGIDVGLARIRAATDGTDSEGNPLGSLAELPCGPLTGRVDGNGPARYRVEIHYLKNDPRGWRDDGSGQSQSWLATNRLICGGSGPTAVPVYALLLSTGSDVPTGDITQVDRRTLRATYTFKTTNQNIAGGLIYVNKVSGSLDLCMDAAQTDPPAAGAERPGDGTPVKMQRCAPGRASQTFAYDANLHLVLVSSQTEANPAGMCLDGGLPHVASTTVRFQPCVPPTTVQNQTRQQWSLNDSSNFRGTTNGVDINNGQCFRVASPNTPGSNIVLGSCSGAANQVNWSLDPTVGAGMANGSNGRFVNFNQFGRCVDVTDFKEDTTFLIVWPCKQLPNGSVAWNQLWHWPALPAGAVSVQGSISTFSTDTGVNRWYCLRSPGVTGYGTYVTITACTPSSPSGATSWTIYSDTTKDADPGNDDKAYTIVDYRGYCLTPRDPKSVPPDFFQVTLGISKVQVAPCDGTTLQKWNAPATFNQRSPLKDIGEDLGQ